MVHFMNLFEQSKKYQPGEIIINEGDTNRDLYILSEGTLEVYVKGDKGEVLVSEMNPPEILGELSFLNGAPRIATVKAKTAAEVYYLSYEQVKEEMSEIPVWLKLILQTLSGRMKQCDLRIKELEDEVRRLWHDMSV